MRRASAIRLALEFHEIVSRNGAGAFRRNDVRGDDFGRTKPRVRLSRGVIDRRPTAVVVLHGIGEMLGRLVDDPRVLGSAPTQFGLESLT